jgi:hypothetical protein
MRVSHFSTPNIKAPLLVAGLDCRIKTTADKYLGSWSADGNYYLVTSMSWRRYSASAAIM